MWLILSIILACGSMTMLASDQLLTVKTTATNAATSVSATANGFVGEIDEISVITSAGVTGNVSIAAGYPYGGPAVVLATNTVTQFHVFRPRVMGVGVAGSTSVVITNQVGGDKFEVDGESITATVFNGNSTSATFKVRIKYNKER